MLFAGMSFGIWLEHAIPGKTRLVWITLACAASSLAWIASRSDAGSVVSLLRLNWYTVAAALAISIGGIRAVQFDTPASNDVAHLLRSERQQDVQIFGSTLYTPGEKQGRARFEMRVDSVRLSGASVPVPASGRVYVSVGEVGTGEWIDWSRAGCRISISGTLREVRPPGNPADFNFRRFLLLKGVRSTIWVQDAASMHRIGPPESIIRRIAVGVERHVERALNLRIPTDEARGVLLALILGRRTDMDDEMLGHFRRTGLMHVLAVSGLHVLMVGMVVYGLLCPILLRFGLRWRTMEAVRATVTLALLLIYGVVTGGSASVTRAIVMAGVLIGGVALQRSTPTINSLAAAGFVLLLHRPTYLWDIGFQLSFGAVAAIVLMHRPLQQPIDERWDEDSWQGRAAKGLITTTAATLGTAPILLYHFGSVSLAGILLNPLAIPASGFALSAGLLTVLTNYAGWVSAAFGQSADFFSHMLMWTAAEGDAYLGWARIDARITYAPYVIALVLLTATIVVMHVPRSRWKLLIATGLMLVMGLWYDALFGSATPRLEILFLDVGQGDAAILRFPNGRFMIVDAGPLDDRMDQGARVVLPHLQWMGAKRLDLALITHPHADHLGGLLSVLRGIPTSRIITNGASYDSDLVDRTHALVDSLGISPQTVGVGDTLLIDEEVRVYVLAPSSRTRSNPDPNEQSIVLRIDYGETSVLLTGDAERESESELIRHFRDELSVDVVKVGHHGSETSSIPPFVRSVMSSVDHTVAVVSVAERNRFGLPDEVVLERWKNAGADVHLTSVRGALWIRLDGKSVEVMEWRQE